LKDEPEGEGIGQLRKAPFGLKLDRDYQPPGGMWESRSDFQGLWEVWENGFIVFPCFPQTVISSAF